MMSNTHSFPKSPICDCCGSLSYYHCWLQETRFPKFRGLGAQKLLCRRMTSEKIRHSRCSPYHPYCGLPTTTRSLTPQSASYPRNSLRLQRSPRTWRVKFELSSSSHRHLRKRHSRIWRNRSGLCCRATAWRTIVLEACTPRSRRTTSKPSHFGLTSKLLLNGETMRFTKASESILQMLSCHAALLSN
jgi:hypothetical protein